MKKIISIKNKIIEKDRKASLIKTSRSLAEFFNGEIIELNPNIVL